jgi:hypothetical protein
MASSVAHTIPDAAPLLARLEDIPPIAIAGVALLFGVVLMFGSLIAGVSSFVAHGKLYGYWYSVNWSLNFVLVIPIAIYFAANTFACIRDLVFSLVASGMIVRPQGKPPTELQILDEWHEFGRSSVIIGLALSGIAFIASWIEFYYSCFVLGRHLSEIGQAGGPVLSWTLAPYFNGANLSGARLFGFVAFTAQGFAASAFLIFVTVMLAFATWIFRFTSNRVTEELIPDLKSTDTRRGFERFEPLIVNLLLAACFFFGLFFLTRLDSAFVLSPHSSIFDFAAKDLGEGFISHDKNQTVPHGPFELPKDEIHYSVMAVGTGMGVLLFMAFLVPSFILSRSAQISCSRAAANQDRLQLPQRAGLSGEEIRDRLQKMTFWPLKYPRPAELMLFLLLGGACFVYFNLTLFLIGALIARAMLLFLGVAAWKKKEKSGDNP